jgi:hypothetical protein
MSGSLGSPDQRVHHRRGGDPITKRSADCLANVPRKLEADFVKEHEGTDWNAEVDPCTHVASGQGRREMVVSSPGQVPQAGQTHAPRPQRPFCTMIRSPQRYAATYRSLAQTQHWSTLFGDGLATP